jgi:hypothetical protein
MKSLFYTLLFFILCGQIIGQTTTITFEDANLEVNQYLNGGDLPLNDNYFYFENLAFQSNYDTAFNYWTSGWAVSTVQDSVTNDFSNIYGAYPLAGSAGSLTYMVGQYTAVIDLSDSLGLGTQVNSVDITNASFPLLVMRDGDPAGFSKKFGGDDGNDPDYFLLEIKGFDAAGDSIGVVPFYLADYRFEDNSMDYIVNEWTTVDLSSLGPVSQLEFSLKSTDENEWGILTPAFYCIDNLNFGIPTNTSEISANSISVAPNPSNGNVFVSMDSNSGSMIRVFDLAGQQILSQYSNDLRTMINLNSFQKGCYLLQVENEGKVYTEKLIIH